MRIKEKITNMENKPKLVTEKKIVAIDSIIPNPYNPNKMSDFIYDRMKKTIAEKGLFGSIICRPLAGCYQILDGEHRWKACKELGYKELPIEVSVEEISDQETRFWTIYFNNTKGKDDIEKVVEIFNSLEAGQEQLLPFTDDEIKNTKDLFAFDFSQYETNNPEIPSDSMVQILSFKFTEDEWKIVQDGVLHAKQDGKVPKQWFMIMLQKYLRENNIKSGFFDIVN